MTADSATMNSASGLTRAVSTVRKDLSACPRMLSLVSHHLRTKKMLHDLRSSLETPTATARVMVDCIDGLRTALQWESKQNGYGCGKGKPSKHHGMLKERVMEHWSVAWKWSSFLVEEIIAKEPLSVEGTEFQRWTLEVVAEFLRLLAFEIQGCPREFEALKAPGFLSTLVQLWFHALRHGGSSAALRDTAFSLILFDSINFSTMDGFVEVIDQVNGIMKDTPDAATICCTHIFNIIQCNTVNMRLLDGPLAFVAYAMEFHDLLSSFITCRLPSLIASVMVHLTSSKLSYDLVNIDDVKWDRYTQENMVEFVYLRCARILGSWFIKYGHPCIIEALRGRFLPSLFKNALFFKRRSNPFQSDLQGICCCLLEMITRYSIYPTISRLVVKSCRYIKKHDLGPLVESTAPLLWNSWRLLDDTAMQRYTQIPSYFFTQREVCGNPQWINPYIRPRDVKRCSGCLVVHYCSRDCQRDDWTGHQLTCKHLMSDRKAGRPVKINTLEHDFAESMVSLDFSTFLVETEGTRAELEEQHLTEPEERYPMVVEVLYNVAPPRLGRIYPGEDVDVDSEIYRAPEVWMALERRRGRGILLRDASVWQKAPNLSMFTGLLEYTCCQGNSASSSVCRSFFGSHQSKSGSIP
ncbi:uncharacterized protein EV420DRAFT_751369 [Desarmillaria tabescens]|uniref:MYND-type domain-containing protein n=1 Tax=Armillaria tabescens TaxID=1929756 RepID=A0AA39JWS6_ARMTA|nr:uncharacterized protein EV420DRAFT_751369 [Desarmillaria tabescens]KAK0450366.1 hypothetical protein EV420DRAFT_751369 [Desarmillaria tabescens]